MSTRSRHHGESGLTRAFTLIELLVVIAIISLLVSILLPSLQRARGLAQEVSCKNQMRSQGLAVLLYHEDYELRSPPLRTDQSNQNDAGQNFYWVWADHLYKYIGGESARPWRDVTTEVFWCPSSEPAFPNYMWGSAGNNKTMDYGLNWGLAGVRVDTTLSLRSGYCESNSVLIGEGPGAHPVICHGYVLVHSDVSSTWGGLDDARHDGRSNVLMAGGNVEGGTNAAYSDTARYNWNHKNW